MFDYCPYRFGTLIPGAKSGESIRIPTSCQWLDGVALRDLAIHEKYAACADARGDVYHWGEKNDKPEQILQGKVNAPSLVLFDILTLAFRT
jgi:hypothetical protein